MGSSFSRLTVAAVCAAVAPIATYAQDSSARWINVQFPRDSPVLMVSSSLGPTTGRLRGASLALDLHASLELRNTGAKPISGLTLRVEAQELTPSGKGSVTLPSLDVAPGEVFPVNIDMQLLRPVNVGRNEESIVQVSLDCALFSDLTSYGPDKLGSRRALAVYEMEARRDRQYLAALLHTGQLAELREELNFGLEDITPQQIGLELLHEPRMGSRHEQPMAVGTVSFPSSPVRPVAGAARVAGNEVRMPEVDLRNTSRKTVRTVELGWIVRDERGRDFVAGSTPASIPLRPIETGRMTEPGTLRFSHPTGQPMLIGAVMAFVNNVEFTDGNLWIPSRRDIQEATPDPVLRRALATSPEQQKLAEVYRRRGIYGLAEELKKAN